MFGNNSKTWRSGNNPLELDSSHFQTRPPVQGFCQCKRWLVSDSEEFAAALLGNRSSKRPKLVAGTLQYVISMEHVPFIDSISGNVPFIDSP